MLDAAQRHLSMFTTAVMLVALVAFLLSTGPAFGSGSLLPAAGGSVAAVQSGADPLLLDIGDPMSIEKEILATPVGNGAVNYDVAVYNYSPVDALRLDSLQDAEWGDLHGRGTCWMPQVVPARSVYRCSFFEQR